MNVWEIYLCGNDSRIPKILAKLESLGISIYQHTHKITVVPITSEDISAVEKLGFKEVHNVLQ